MPVWRKETRGGHEVVIYESQVWNVPLDTQRKRTVFGRVKLGGRWFPHAWSKYGRAYDKSPNPLDLVDASPVSKVAA